MRISRTHRAIAAVVMTAVAVSLVVAFTRSDAPARTDIAAVPAATVDPPPVVSGEAATPTVESATPTTPEPSPSPEATPDATPDAAPAPATPSPADETSGGDVKPRTPPAKDSTPTRAAPERTAKPAATKTPAAPSTVPATSPAPTPTPTPTKNILEVLLGL